MDILYNHAKFIYSQNGEDGVLDEIFKRIGITSPGWVCEFGAWDGKHLSNTYLLVTKGWRAVFIEADSEKYKDLLVTCKEHPHIVPVNAMVTADTFNTILGNTPIPSDFDVLSIDIDSYDYEVWEGLTKYRPKIVIVEINSSVRPGIYQQHNPALGLEGASFTSMLELGKSKGYTFVCHTGNMIFVADKYASKFNIPNPPESVFRTCWLPN
jgi:hypothetical protein